MAGISLVELMVAMVLGLIVLAGLASLFANSSAARSEMERSSRQIENGRFAIELLSDDLRMAGFYGELNAGPLPAPGALPDPCSTNVADWGAAILVSVQGYDNGAAAPGCLPGSVKPGTDVVVIRRAATCVAGAAGCEPVAANLPYVQVSRCSPENVNKPYEMGLYTSPAAFPLRLRNCATPSGLRRYFVRIYFISTDNGAGQAVPTLKRLDFNGTGFVETPLVEGIEELNIEYGIDWDGNGSPNDYSADPSKFGVAGCGTCDAVSNWSNVVTARISLLARNVEPSPNYADTKEYSLGLDADGNDVTVKPGGAYRRHAYTGLVRIVNVAQRREKPV
jgi:type IV pilus assembly protein PilW